VLPPNGQKLYVTYSGLNTTVTIYAVGAAVPTPVFVNEVTVEVNPFGLTCVP
jgi:hypothetical protein